MDTKEAGALPAKIFSIGEGESFLYETVTNRIFRIEQSGSFNERDLIKCLINSGKISASILAAPKFSMSFNEYRRAIEQKMQRLILEVTRRCNMRCSYCVYSGKFFGRRTHENFDMSRETMERAINFYAAHSTALNDGSISFYGGEPLLRADEIFHAISFAARVMPGKKLDFAISTNGLLLDEKILSYLAKNPAVTLNITLNGSPHDKYRRTADGKATLENLLDKLSAAKKNFPQVWRSQIGFICNYANIEELTAQRNFYLNVVGKMPLLINQIMPPSQADLFSNGSAREKLADTYFRGGEDFLGAYFRVPVAVIHDRPIFTAEKRSFINSCIPFTNRIFVAADGRFQICTETTELDALGDLNSGFNFGELKKLYYAAEKIFVDSACRRCWAQRLCPACFKDFLTPTGSVEPVAPFLCLKFRASLLCDLKLYCRLAYHRRDLLKRLIDC